MRAAFEARTGAFSPEDAWFEERSRAFWLDAVTRGSFGRAVEGDLTDAEARWLGPLGRAHRGLFRMARAPEGLRVVDVWSGAEYRLTEVDEPSRDELEASAGQLFDGRVVGGESATIALLPGAIFHPRHASEAIDAVLSAAREQDLATHDLLDALLRMERTLRALSRVKAAYAYRPAALSPKAPAVPTPVRSPAKEPT